MEKDFIKLKNKVCLVTGCNGHIGNKITNKLASLGVKIIGTDLNYKKNKNLKMFLQANLENRDDINQIIRKINKKFKKIDILINNAGYVGTSEVNNKNYKKVFYNEKFEKLNLSNTIYFTNCLLKNLKRSSSASIINISSIYSFLGYDYKLYKDTIMRAPLAYGVSKAGLVQYTKILSNALAPQIRVNAISPGGIFRKQPKKFIKRYLDKTPLGRMGSEADVANAVIFLSSNLSTYITGQNIIVDGGYSNA
tara:strand:+ start:197 stop:949 length:753 start_codon:yes stop_codon:yes gene_type:complete